MKLLGMTLTCDALERGGEAERAFLSFTCNLLDDAVALMVQPRVAITVTATAMEFTMITHLPLTLDVLARQARPEHKVWHQRLTQAQARLRQSGVIEKRGLESVDMKKVQACGLETDRSWQERRDAATSGLLKCCAMAGCGAKEAHVSQFGKCSACKAAVYCCRDHQQADWPAHKAACKAARKAAAAATDAA
jgi:hypothetical protein